MKISTLLLDSEQKQICYGTLLGDCAISMNGRNARLQMHHGFSQVRYIYWKYKKLQSICTRKSFSFKKPGKNSYSNRSCKIRLQTLNSPDLTQIFFLLRKNGGKKVVTREYLDLLEPLAITVWFCDDGSLTGGGRQAELCTHDMSEQEVQIIQKFFEEKWGIKCTIRKKSSPVTKGKLYYFLSFYTKNAEKLLKLIIPLIPEKSMVYKTFLQFNADVDLQNWNSYLISQYVPKFFKSEDSLKTFMEETKKSKTKNQSNKDML